MQSLIHIQSCNPKVFAEISQFVWQIYQSDVARYNQIQGHQNFQAFTSTSQLISRASQGSIILEARVGDQRIGMCEFRHQHVFLLFIDPAYRRQGVGSQLLQKVKEAVDQKGFSPFLTLNASPNAVPFYEKLGFRTLAPEADKNGLRSTLMKLNWHIS